MEDGAAEGAETLPYFTVNSTDDGRARVQRVLLRAGEVREECLPGSRDVATLDG